MSECLNLKIFENYHNIDLYGAGSSFYILARMKSKYEENLNPDIVPFFFKRDADNAVLGQKVYEYLLKYSHISEEDLKLKKASIKEVNAHLLEKCAQSEQLPKEKFLKLDFILEIYAEKKCLTISPSQRLCAPGMSHIAFSEIEFRESVEAKELGYWVKEGLDRCFVRGHYKIPKSKGLRIKYNRKADPILPPGTPEGTEVALPRHNTKLRVKTSATLYLKEGLLIYHKNIYSRAVERYMMDIYAPYGCLKYSSPDKEIGILIHSILLMLFPQPIPEEQQLGRELYVQEAYRIEREFFNDLKSRLNLQTDEELFDGMLCCHAVELQKNFLLAPTRRIGFKEFTMIGKKYVVENARCTASELGRAVREAFKRCETTPTSELSSLLNYD